MLKKIFSRLSPHAQFSIFLGIVFGVMAVIVSGALGFSMAKTAMITFLVAAICYLMFDFYEHFGE